jgi:hypothetical protein
VAFAGPPSGNTRWRLCSQEEADAPDVKSPAHAFKILASVIQERANLGAGVEARALATEQALHEGLAQDMPDLAADLGNGEDDNDPDSDFDEDAD